MRILHTSDWHLGRVLEGRSRLPEQEEFLDELCDIADQEEIDLVLVAGDVYNTYNPPAAAQALFYDELERLAAGASRAVVVIAGNHDHPDRVHAANPLALRHGISLVGYPGEKLTTGGPEGGPVRTATGNGWFELYLPNRDETALIYTLAYPSEARLNELLSASLDEESQQFGFAGRIRQILKDADETYRPDTVNILVSHLFMLGGRESESERPIQLGGALAVEPDALPSHAHYVALGHLHRPQEVRGCSIPCRYAGSPLSYSFSEADQQKEVVIVDASPGRQAEVSTVKLTSGKPLKRWKADSLDEVYQLCENPANLDCYVDLEVKLKKPLTTQEMARLRRTHPGIVNVRPILPEVQVEEEKVRLSELSLKEQFRRFVLCEQGHEPPAELVDLFFELLGDDQPGGEAQ